MKNNSQVLLFLIDLKANEQFRLMQIGFELIEKRTDQKESNLITTD